MSMVYNEVDLAAFKPERFDRGAGAIKEGFWLIVSLVLFRFCPLKLSRLKTWMLRLFGAQVGQGVVIKPNVRITFPWRLSLGDHVWLGEDAWLLNLAPITLESHVCVSQGAFLCTGSHDYTSTAFDLIVKPIVAERGAWISAGAFVGPGVRVGSHAVLTAHSAAAQDLEPFGIYQGNPAKFVRRRVIVESKAKATSDESARRVVGSKENKTVNRRRAKASTAVTVMTGCILIAIFATAPTLRAVAAFLIVEDSLAPAEAIVSLGGHTPFREIEAARLYRQGLAAQVIVVPSEPGEEAAGLRRLGIETREDWELRREVLIREGVPASAILVPPRSSGGTLEELEAAYGVLKSKDEPVILVTSKFHTRRTGLTWRHVTHGRSRGIVRAAPLDPFEASRWWHRRSFILSVVREYLGLVNYYAGFPVGADALRTEKASLPPSS
jgi:putative colanic acid biosynthesis acetyltransferase WcaF